MKVLVVDSDGLSLGYRLIETESRRVLASGLVERIGEAVSMLTHKCRPGTEMETRIVFEQTVPDHEAGLRTAIRLITDPEHGVLRERSEIGAVSHRVVPNGEGFEDPVQSCAAFAAAERGVFARKCPGAPAGEAAREERDVCRRTACGGATAVGLAVRRRSRADRLAG